MVEIDPPWRLDPLQTIVDVGWGDPLGIALWTFDLPASGGGPVPGWVLYGQFDEGATSEEYAAALTALLADGYDNLGGVEEATATGLVRPFAFDPTRGNVFFSFGDALSASGMTAEVPTDFRSFTEIRQRTIVLAIGQARKVFVNTVYVVSTS